LFGESAEAAVAEARQQVRKLEKEECPPLETFTKRRVKSQEEYKIQVYITGKEQ
jgi:hypothetical protein